MLVPLLDVLELPCRPASNSALPAAVARPVSAATVEATLDVELAVAVDPMFAVFAVLAALDEFKRLDRAEALLDTLLIDIIEPRARDARTRLIGLCLENLSDDLAAVRHSRRRSVTMTISRGTPKRMGNQCPNPADTSRYASPFS